MRCDAAEFFYRVEHDRTEKAIEVSKRARVEHDKAIDISKRAREERDNAIQALKNETAERARVERAYNGVVEENEALERRVEELEAELAKKQKVLDYIADAEKEDAV
jgi:hypothetical protein